MKKIIHSNAQRLFSQIRKVLSRKNFLLSDRECHIYQSKAFENLGLSYEQGLINLNRVLLSSGRKPFNEVAGSNHWLFFSALSLVRQPIKILEIGTFDGDFTFILALLFPKSQIITVDLPDSDPQVRSTYHRSATQVFDDFLRRRKENLSSPNITFIQDNSFNLPSHKLAEIDIIWLDGDHSFPALSWDFCNAYHLLRKGGLIVCDDVYRYPIFDKTKRSHSREILEYLSVRNLIKLDFILKRTAKIHSADPWHRKYLGVLQK